VNQVCVPTQERVGTRIERRRSAMMDIQKSFFFFTVLVLVSFFFLPRAHGFTENCRKAVHIYNQALGVEDLAKRESLLIHALSLGCTDKKIKAKIHNNLADTHEKQGRIEKAVSQYQKAINADPYLSTPYLSLGDIHARLKRDKDAARFYEKGFVLKNYRTGKEIVASLNPERSIMVVPSMTLYFGFDWAGLSAQTEKQLRTLADALKNDELIHYRFCLEGHTCSKGAREYNQALSERRAGAVKHWLEAHAILQDRLMAQGFGEDRPIADNTGEQGHRHNRRVEIRTIGIVMPDVSRSTYGPEHIHALKLLKEGEYLLAKERYNDAVEHFLSAMNAFKEEKYTEGTRAALMDLELAYRFLGDWEKAEYYRNQLK